MRIKNVILIKNGTWMHMKKKKVSQAQILIEYKQSDGKKEQKTQLEHNLLIKVNQQKL